METSEENIIADLSLKYNVSGFQLMEYLNISYKNGQYFYQNVSYEKYAQALQIADTTFDINQERDAQNNESDELENNAKLTSGEIEWRKKINKKRIVFLTLLVLYLPLGGVVHTITKSDSITIPIVVSHLFVIACLGINIFSSSCPRCGKKFFYTIAFKNHFSTKCLHCGFSLISTIVITK